MQKDSIILPIKAFLKQYPRLTRFLANYVDHFYEDYSAYKVFLQDNRDSWLEKLTKNDIPCAPILSAPEAMNTPQVLSRGMVQEYNLNSNKYLIAGNPIKFEKGAEVFNLAPKLGQNTQSVLKKYLDYSEEKINNLISEGIIK